MNYLKNTAILLAMLFTFSSCQEQSESNLTLLSNQVPTDSPLIFGQGVISTDAFEFAITFNPEMTEMYFTRRKPEARNNIYESQFIDGKWSEPALASFSSDSTWDFEPHISPKGDVLYYGTSKALNDTLAPSGIHEWYINKGKDGWGQPYPMASPFVDRFIMYLTSSENGNLYFTGDEPEAQPDDELSIFYAINEQGEYGDFTKMEKEINSGTMIAHPFIAPDESYMIFDGIRDSGYGDCDLYISFNENGIWSESYNMGPEINTDQCEMCASVSPDGKFLFFHRGVYIEGEKEVGNIYWADFIRIKERLENI